jgi:hypothetical protein
MWGLFVTFTSSNKTTTMLQLDYFDIDLIKDLYLQSADTAIDEATIAKIKANITQSEIARFKKDTSMCTRWTLKKDHPGYTEKIEAKEGQMYDRINRIANR